MTESAISAAIYDGHGQGRDENYLPWLRVRRRLSSPVSNLLVAPNPVHRRALHLLARTEYAAALVACWLGATEIREQFPLWPIEHPHPNASALDAAMGKRPLVSGLMDLAEQLGIRHGVYPGTKLPFIATTDLLLSFSRNDAKAEPDLAFWACKPAEQLVEGAPGAERRLQRLQLEQAYARECCAAFAVIDGTQFPKELIKNLDWMTPLRSEVLAHGRTSRLHEFTERCDELASELPLREAVMHAAMNLSIDEHLAWLLFRVGAWSGRIDVDLSRPVLTTLQTRRGGSVEKERLRKALTLVSTQAALDSQTAPEAAKGEDLCVVATEAEHGVR